MHRFLSPDLKIGKTGTGEGLEQRLLNLSWQFDLERYFEPYDIDRHDNFYCHISNFRRILDAASIVGDDGTKNGEKWLRKRRLTKGDARKPTEAIAVSHISGALDDEQSVHIHDLCAGTGIVSVTSACVRGRERQTIADCWENNPDRKAVHLQIMDLLGISNVGVRFRIQDVREADLTAEQGAHSYWLAKHACGPLSASILQKLRLTMQQRPEHMPEGVAIVTCCHGKARHHPPMWTCDVGLEDRLWQGLAKSADWVNCDDLYKRIVGRASMRVIDTLHARFSGIPGLKVQEILPSSLTQKNQAFVLGRNHA